ncbi:TrbC/VIRB2 family protein [uncultured archaeon]|nr:TrbC/VIRB2 family protein [uncultured archaeon]
MIILKKKLLVLTLVLSGLALAADPLTIPADQPICRIYSLIQTIGTIVAVIMLAYSGFQLMSATDLVDRKKAKNMLMYTILGLVIIWLAPLIIQYITQSTTC